MLDKGVKNIGLYAALVLSVLAYYYIGYQLHRSSFELFIALYALLFGCFLYLYKFSPQNKLKWYAWGFRAILIFAIPNLSDDFYRFIWDGRLIMEGLNPYLYLPENDTSLVAEGEKLYVGMGAMNGSHYTCYPPVNQFVFLIPALFFAKNLFAATVVLRLTIIAADIGTFYFVKKILKYLKMPEKKVFLYVLNPFVILELTGNLHFEGVLLLFLMGALYFLAVGKFYWSALFFAISVSVKLIPLLFVPILLKKLGVYKLVLYASLVVLLNLLFFIPFMSPELYHNFMDSIHLYFQNFEFNASIYYLIREIGYTVKGYNIIQTVGKITPVIVFVLVWMIALFRKNRSIQQISTSMMFAIVVYYAFASIVHPWYIAIPLLLSVFTGYRFALVWSLVVMLSYAAYKTAEYHENLYLVSAEYILVFVVLFFELQKGVLAKSNNFFK